MKPWGKGGSNFAKWHAASAHHILGWPGDGQSDFRGGPNVSCASLDWTDATLKKKLIWIEYKCLWSLYQDSQWTVMTLYVETTFKRKMRRTSLDISNNVKSTSFQHLKAISVLFMNWQIYFDDSPEAWQMLLSIWQLLSLAQADFFSFLLYHPAAN